jgi:hypothetical protein
LLYWGVCWVHWTLEHTINTHSCVLEICGFWNFNFLNFWNYWNLNKLIIID